MNAQAKAYEQKIADLVRRLGTDYEGEIVATVGVLKRLLVSQGVTFTDLGDAVERLATGGLIEAEMKRVFDAGYHKGVEDTERKYANSGRRARPPSRRLRRLGGDRALLPALQSPHRTQPPPVRRRHGVAHELGAGADREAGKIPAKPFSRHWR